jgi:magnesium transporter
MITVYQKQDQQIIARVLDAGESVPTDAVWIDMLSPTHEEEIAVEKQLGIQIPSREEVWKNQALNRFYQEDDVSYMTAAIITKLDAPYPQTSAVTFILTSRYLLTMRYIVPTSFHMFVQRIQRAPRKFTCGAQVLEGLLEEIITRVAHNSEVVVDALDQLSHDIFGGGVLGVKPQHPSRLLKEVLTRLGTCADLNSKISESLHSLSRLLAFFKHVHATGGEIDANINTQTTDVMALSQQTAFLSDKITFQLDATLGMINVEQNQIIKIFSVVAVFFMPPTLVSSIYGMNFTEMPELHWMFGYPMALSMMIACAVVPYVYFRKKGWL